MDAIWSEISSIMWIEYLAGDAASTSWRRGVPDMRRAPSGRENGSLTMNN
jgi:hypothetical protein